jgi:hypothetical protein
MSRVVCRTENMRKPYVKKLLPFATFDIETTLIGADELVFLDSCVYDGLMYSHYYDAYALVEHFFTHPGYRYYAHNGSRFDFSFLMDALTAVARKEDYKIDPIIQGEDRLIGLIIRKGKRVHFELRDSLALIPMSLKEATAIYADTQKGDIGLGDGVSYNRNDDSHIAYLHHDVLGLYEVLENFQKLVHLLFGTTIGFTAGSTALNAWRAAIPTGHAYYRLHQHFENYARAAYYGGYVYPGKDIEPHEDVVILDYNAAYAARMRQGVPGRRHWETSEYDPDLPGIYHVIVNVPKSCARPPLPYRDKKGAVRWQTGTFDTTVTSIELEYALTKGCSFQVLSGVVWECLEYPFDEFLEKCEQFELRDGGKNKAVSKLMRNSLYGKFGTKDISKRYYIQLDNMRPLETEWLMNEQTGEMIDYIYAKWEKNTSDCIFPHWAAWITAGQRIELLKAMDTLGTPLYGDTDSVFCYRRDFDRAVLSGALVVGKNYGMLKLEKELKIFNSFGPKNYHAITIDDIYYGKVKGIPRKLLKSEHYETYDPLNPPEVAFFSVRSAFMSMTHPEKPMQQKRTRKLSTLMHSDGWKLNGTKITPLHVELCQLQLE